MTRIWHSASYYMPLFSSSQSTIVITSIFVAGSIYIFMYSTSFWLLNQYYDDPSMFSPNSQDYFRTLLLGFFSPFLYSFVKKFLFNITERLIITNIFFDFPLNDWYMFLLIICLAYPQIQDNSNFEVQNDDDFASSEWHIIPRQSYLFGIAWSLGEFFISICNNIFLFEEITDELVDEDIYETVTENGDTINNINRPRKYGLPHMKRTEITLSQCLKVRNDSSTLSDNVYSSLTNLATTNYGSTNANIANSEDSKHSRNNNSNTNDSENPIILVSSLDNSLTLTTNSAQRKINEQKKNKENSESNLSGSDFIDSSDTEEIEKIHYFNSISTKREFIRKLLTMSLIIINNVLLSVGQNLMLSIYFIYVRGHERLFTKAVNYFGQRSIWYFLLVIVLPLSIFNLCSSIIVYFWKDFELLLENNKKIKDSEENDYYNNPENTLINNETLMNYGEFSSFRAQTTRPRSNSIRDFYKRYSNFHDDKENSNQNNDHETSNTISNDVNDNNRTDVNPINSINRGYINSMAHQDSTFYVPEEDESGEPTVIIHFKKFIEFWKILGKNPLFIFSFMTIWSVSIFICGLVCTIYQ